MNNKGFLEVETPILVDIPAGGRAIPFSTYHESFEKDLFLRIATELHLKKLIVGGIEKVYEIAFGDDAINRGFTRTDVIDQLKELSDNYPENHHG